MAKRPSRKQYTKEKNPDAGGLGFAKKSLGQNFLHSESALKKIVEAGKLKKGDIVLEIGPGRGALTKKILEAGARVVAVEKDRELVPYLGEIFGKEVKRGQLTIIEADILDFDPARYQLKAAGYKLIANIPYYITGAIFKKFLGSKQHPSYMVVLVQDEVARRITTTGKESILSLSVKAYGAPRYVAKVPRGAFSPAPNVDSAILAIEAVSKERFGRGKEAVDEQAFFELIHAGFAHKRKVLISNLKGYKKPVELEILFTELGLTKTTRAEDVPLATWLLLCKKIQTR